MERSEEKETVISINRSKGAGTPEKRSGLIRTLNVIMLISDHAPESLGVSAIARQLMLPKAVAHRILKELVGAKFLEFNDDDKQYRLGQGALKVGLAAMRSIEVPRIARPHLERLARETQETATLSARQGMMRVYIDQVISPREMKMIVSIGPSYPLYAGSSSKAILAALPDSQLEEYFSHFELQSITESTITSLDDLWRDIDDVRRTGYAASRGERQTGAGSVAAPIYKADGDVFGSISLCGPLDRFSSTMQKEYGELLVNVAAEISADLGYRAQAETNQG